MLSIEVLEVFAEHRTGVAEDETGVLSTASSKEWRTDKLDDKGNPDADVFLTANAVQQEEIRARYLADAATRRVIARSIPKPPKRGLGPGKITPKLREYIRTAHFQGKVSQRELAIRLNVARLTIALALGKGWKKRA